MQYIIQIEGKRFKKMFEEIIVKTIIPKVGAENTGRILEDRIRKSLAFYLIESLFYKKLPILDASKTLDRLGSINNISDCLDVFSIVEENKTIRDIEELKSIHDDYQLLYKEFLQEMKKLNKELKNNSTIKEEEPSESFIRNTLLGAFKKRVKKPDTESLEFKDFADARRVRPKDRS